MRRILPMFCAVCAWAQSGIETPDLGAIVDSTGAFRPVQGVAGNFLLGPAPVSGVLSAACSERQRLAKTDGKIVSLTGEVDAPPGPVIVGFEGDHAVIFFAESRTFARWKADAIEPLDSIVDGDVLSIAFVNGEPQIAVRRRGNVWIVRPDGGVLGWIAQTDGPVLLLPEGVVFARDENVILRRPDGSELQFALPGVESITAMGSHYGAIRAGEAIYALRIDSGREQLYLLPGSVP